MADLVELSAGIEASEPVVARAADAGRLAALGDWLAATSGRRPSRPDRIRLVHTAALSPGAARLAAAHGVGTRLLSFDPSDSADGDPTAAAAVEAGIAAADDEIDAGCDLLLLATADRAAAAVVVALLTSTEPVRLLPRGAAAADSAAWCTAAGELRDRRRRAAALRYRPAELLTGADGVDSLQLAAAAGFLLRSTARRTPLLLDGAGAMAAALVACELRPAAAQWWQIADTGNDPVATRAADHLGQRPLLDLGAEIGDGVAALLAVPIVRGAAMLHNVEDVDE